MSRESKFLSKPGSFAFIASLIILTSMLILAGTPLAWIISGRPAESYPELLFLGIGVPVGLILTVITGVIFWYKNFRLKSSKGLK